MKLIRTLRNLLLNIVNDIDAGNSNLTDAEIVTSIELINKLAHKETRFSKYQVCKYLNVSRATFDNYVRAGKIPKGTKEVGWKELSWNQLDLDKYLLSLKK